MQVCIRPFRACGNRLAIAHSVYLSRHSEPELHYQLCRHRHQYSQAALSQHGTKKVIIGKDTRISGYMLETALESGLIAAGIDVILLGPMPTPAVAYLAQTFRAEAGIVISASHNPYYDNGIKFFNGQGLKLDDVVELQIEAMLDEPMTCVASDKLGKATRLASADGR